MGARSLSSAHMPHDSSLTQEQKQSHSSRMTTAAAAAHTYASARWRERLNKREGKREREVFEYEVAVKL